MRLFAAVIEIQDLKAILDEGKTMNLIDVRPLTEFGICRLESSKSECRCYAGDIFLIVFRRPSS